MGKRVPDVVIVGAGTSGCVLAARLSENPNREVLLLEAGRDFADQRAFPSALLGYNESAVVLDEYSWTFPGRIVQGSERMIPQPRGKVIGGSSSINGAIHLRPMREDFSAWPRSSWSWSHVQGALQRVEDDLDFPDGPPGVVPVQRAPRSTWSPLYRAFVAAAEDRGYAFHSNLNEPSATGVGQMPRNRRDGMRVNAALAYATPARSRRNLQIRGGATVERVTVSGGRATGVECVIDGARRSVAAGAVILTAGALATPSILLRSGIGAAADSARLGIRPVVHLPGVGATLWDHPTVPVEMRPRRSEVLLAPEAPGRLQTILVTTAPGSPYRNDITVMPDYRPAALWLVAALNRETSCGWLRLRSADAAVAPEVELNYLDTEADRSRLRTVTRLAVELARRSALAELGEAPELTCDRATLESDDALDRWLREHIRSNAHSMGTCRMAEPEDLGVVDERGRVHGVANLIVGDISITPAPISSNTNSTAYLIAERIAALADHP